MDAPSFWQRFLDWFTPEGGDASGIVAAWLVAAVGVLLVLLVLALVLRRMWRTLFRRRKAPAPDWDRDLHEDLSACPLPVLPPGDPYLTVYHLPVRLRLVVVAPAGKEADVDATAVEKLLDRVVPGLGTVAYHDRPRIRVWPPQFSHQGFAIAFFRRAERPEPEGQPSRWVLVAGRAQVGRQTVLVGLGLWADEPNAVGQVTLEPHQWLDVIRLKTGRG
jgi:hypothetical protein